MSLLIYELSSESAKPARDLSERVARISPLMAKWLEWAPQGHEMYCHDLEVMGLNPGWVELQVHSTSVQVVLEPKI